MGKITKGLTTKGLRKRITKRVRNGVVLMIIVDMI